jgi:hypothetical protein
MTGEVDKLMLRPTAWKLLLNVFPFDKPVTEWLKLIKKQRNEYKEKLKNLNALKKFAGDPLGGNSDVKIKIKKY